MAGRDPSMYGSRDRVPVLSVASSGTSRERSLSQDRLASASHDRDTPARAHLSSPSGISSVFEHGHSAWDRHACKFVDAEWIKQGHKALGYDAEPPPETRSLYGSSDNRAAGGGAYIGGRLDARTDYVRARDYQTRYAENKYSAYPSAAGVERRGGYGYDRYGP